MSNNHIYTLKIQTNLPGSDYWIRIRRNNQYIRPLNTVINESDNPWIEVHSKPKPIYYWVIENHNLFDKRNPKYKLYYIDPDLSIIKICNQSLHVALNNHNELCEVYGQLKHQGMKMTPNFFIAKHINQIKEALECVKYCVVKIDNNEQKLVEDINQLDN